VTGTGPSLEDALALYDLGLAPIPAPADDGKSVKGTVAHHNKWRWRLSRAETEDLFRKHPGANVAILPHLCRPPLVVVDCDDEEALAAAEQCFGPTPLVVQTPREAGGHLYYRAPADGQVRQQNLRRSDGLAIDIKAGPGAVVIVPPSVRPSTGRPYAFLKGDWSLLDRLPVFQANQLLRSVQGGGTGQAGIGEARVPVGGRNDHLFRDLLRLAPACDGAGDLALRAHALNASDFDEPLPWDDSTCSGA
jgi:hypothetical protein